MKATVKGKSLLSLPAKPVFESQICKGFRPVLKPHSQPLVKSKAESGVPRTRVKVLIASPTLQTEGGETCDLPSSSGVCPPPRSLKRFPLFLSKILVSIVSTRDMNLRSKSVQRPRTSMSCRHPSARRSRESLKADKYSWMSELGRSISNERKTLCPEVVRETLSHGYVRYMSPRARNKSPFKWEGEDLHTVDSGIYRKRRAYRSGGNGAARSRTVFHLLCDWETCVLGRLKTGRSLIKAKR